MMRRRERWIRMIDERLRELDERLIDYRPLSLLGRGGFADVFLAKDPSGQLVAVKVGRERANGGYDLEAGAPERAESLGERLAAPVVLDEEGVTFPSFGPHEVDAVLETEYRLLSAGSGIMPEPLALLSRGGRAVLVLEQIEGASLRELMQQGGQIRSETLIQVLAALQALHMSSRIRYHGEIKPEHVVVRRDGRIRLLDPAYRAPLVLAPDPLPARLLALSATPEYNPFLLSGPPADCFAVAVMLYELVAGRRPFARDDTPWDWAGVVAWQPATRGSLERYLNLPAPHELRPSVSPALGETIMSALRTRGEGRDLLARLSAALAESPFELSP